MFAYFCALPLSLVLGRHNKPISISARSPAKHDGVTPKAILVMVIAIAYPPPTKARYGGTRLQCPKSGWMKRLPAFPFDYFIAL
jgi:hypothetical protein